MWTLEQRPHEFCGAAGSSRSEGGGEAEGCKRPVIVGVLCLLVATISLWCNIFPHRLALWSHASKARLAVPTTTGFSATPVPTVAIHHTIRQPIAAAPQHPVGHVERPSTGHVQPGSGQWHWPLLVAALVAVLALGFGRWRTPHPSWPMAALLEVDAPVETNAALAVEVPKKPRGRPASQSARTRASIPKSILVQELKGKSLEELRSLALEMRVEAVQEMLVAQDFIVAILKKQAANGGSIIGSGVVDMDEEGRGFLRLPENSYIPGPDDIYVPAEFVRMYKLRTGDTVTGTIRPAKSYERHATLLTIQEINFEDPEEHKKCIPFDDLTPIFPSRRLVLENGQQELLPRVVDLVTPVGMGQRALIVAPPRTGKTVIMQAIANSIAENHPNVNLIVLLIDERPEEVTEMQRSVKGEVISSTFDENPTRHVKVAEIVLEKAKRLVEHKRDVVILLDSITRLARAHNTVTPPSGKVLTGGLDASALLKPKQFFGAARNVEEGGSLTIVSTALIETGSRMDEVIFEEFKGTGNMELVLERLLSDRRIFPAIDINRSGTRKEDLLFSTEELQAIWRVRRKLSSLFVVDAMLHLLERLQKFPTNEAFLQHVREAPPPSKDPDGSAAMSHTSSSDQRQSPRDRGSLHGPRRDGSARRSGSRRNEGPRRDGGNRQNSGHRWGGSGLLMGGH